MTNHQITSTDPAAPLGERRRTELLPILLTVRQAAEILAIGRTTAYELIAAGHLEVVHIGRSVRVPVEAVEVLVDRLRRKAS